MSTSGTDSLSFLLGGPGETRQIGPERGRQLHDGIAVFKSTATKGSSRYVFYEDGHPVAALQTVVLSPTAPARIANVYVVPHRRRAGLATALLKRARKDGPVEHADEDQISDMGKAWRDVVGNAKRKLPERPQYAQVPPFLKDGGAALDWARENIADFDADDSSAEDAAYTYADFAGAAFRVGVLTVYRAISVPVQKNGTLGIRFGCLGTSWSKNRSGADVYNPVPHSGELKKVVLTGEVAPEDVDWEYALTSFMLYGEDQWEVSLLPNAPVTVTHIDEAPLEPAVEGNTGPTIEQWRDCPPKKVKRVEKNPLTPNRTLYHGTTRAAAEQIVKSGGLAPSAGGFVSEMYGELADVEDLPELVFAADKSELSKALTAMRHQIGRARGGDLHGVTEDDIRNQGALLVIRDGDRYMKHRSRHNEDEDHPGTVEPGDYYTEEPLDVDAVLTGAAMMRVLKRFRLLPLDRFGGPVEPLRKELRTLAMKHHRDQPRAVIEAKLDALPEKEVRRLLRVYQGMDRGALEKNGSSLPRTSTIFDRLFDQLAADFDDFGEIELHCDKAAGSDNGHGSERQFGYCSTEAPWRIAFAAKIETLPDEYISGLVRHELGHALDHRYGRNALEKRFGKKLPDSVERRADKIAEYAFGEPIEYGDLDIQCVACEGKAARPKRLG